MKKKLSQYTKKFFTFFKGSGIFVRKKFLVFSTIAASISFIAHILHYKNIWFNNPGMWVGWISALLFFCVAFAPKKTFFRTKNLAKRIIFSKIFIVFILFSLLYFLSHLWNYSSAPWNFNGLFDDAAWDIYYAKKYVLTDKPFQAAFFDFGISREIVYHYYLTFFFKTIGYNLISFNIAALLLGYITYIFTLLTIYSLIKNLQVVSIAAIIFSFFPFHFFYSFAAHRYAISAPLLMSSFYFLHKGLKKNSSWRVVLSGILAGLCFEGAIMGKQYLLSLLGAGMLFLLFSSKEVTKKKFLLSLIFMGALFITAIPMISYIQFNPIYFTHERELAKDFFTAIRTHGLLGLQAYADRFVSVVLHKNGPRWFLPEFLPVPLGYFPLIGIGGIIALRKKLYAILLLSSLPLAASFVSEAYDFRFLDCVSFWIIFISLATKALWDYAMKTKSMMAGFLIAAYVFFLFLGLIPSIRYIHTKSTNPLSLYFFAQKDVASARFLKNRITNQPNPNQSFQWDELAPKTKNTLKNVYICQSSGFATTHLFLYDFDDKKILSFCDGLPSRFFTSQEILQLNRKVVLSLQASKEAFHFFWEVDPKTKGLIAYLEKQKNIGEGKRWIIHDTNYSFEFFEFTVAPEKLTQFQKIITSSKIEKAISLLP